MESESLLHETMLEGVVSVLMSSIEETYGAVLRPILLQMHDIVALGVSVISLRKVGYH